MELADRVLSACPKIDLTYCINDIDLAAVTGESQLRRMATTDSITDKQVFQLIRAARRLDNLIYYPVICM